MLIIQAIAQFQGLAERARLCLEDLTPIREGLLGVRFESRPELLRLEIIEVVKAYNTKEDKVSREHPSRIACAN